MGVPTIHQQSFSGAATTTAPEEWVSAPTAAASVAPIFQGVVRTTTCMAAAACPNKGTCRYSSSYYAHR